MGGISSPGSSPSPLSRSPGAQSGLIWGFFANSQKCPFTERCGSFVIADLFKRGKKQNRDKGEKSGRGQRKRITRKEELQVIPAPLPAFLTAHLSRAALNQKAKIPLLRPECAPEFRERRNCACGEGVNKILASRLPGSGSSCQRGDRHTKPRAALRVRACLLVLWVEAFGESLGASSRGSPCEQCSHI